MKKIIKTDRAPAPVGPYNQAIIAGNLVFTAGQIPLDPNTGEMAAAEIGTQTRLAIENLKAVVEAAGSDLSRVIKTTVFLKDMNDFAAMNAVYNEFFSENSPARSAVEVARLPKDALVEIECIAEIE